LPKRWQSKSRAINNASVKLILLEDDPLILVCTEDALADAGFEVLPASTGEEALELLRTSDGVRGMMIDVRLGGALNGWEIARRVRETYPGMAIVYTTTALTLEYGKHGVDRSVLLQKPYTLDRAVSSMREALSKVET
jgi:DNA-binding response OmpR family regulator